jgi:hypothetical protein
VAMLFLRDRSRGLSLQDYAAIRKIVDATPHRVLFQESAHRPHSECLGAVQLTPISGQPSARQAKARSSSFFLNTPIRRAGMLPLQPGVFAVGFAL